MGKYNAKKKRDYYKKNREKILAYHREYAQKNPEKLRAYSRIHQKEYAQKNREKIKIYQRAYDIKRRYGITLEEVDEILKRQKHKCGICGILLSETKRHIDHDHKNQRVRGILCFDCNTGLGKLGDSIKLLKQAIEYLQEN